jgi:competence protein ComEA
MIKEIGILVLMIFLLSGVWALCNETQIDINTANLTELDRIKWIGPSTATNIINYREKNPFDSLDELINVSGIGEKKLADIKAEGLACVNEKIQNTEKINESDEKTNNNSEKQLNSNNIQNNVQNYSENKTITLTPIALNIKGEEDKEILKKNLALGGIVIFCIGFGALFLFKFVRRKNRNEFR